MHELAITQSVVDAVLDRVDRVDGADGANGGARVCELTLQIGRLSGVVADSVRFCFDLVTEGTALEGARLVICEPPGAGQCRACGETFTMADDIALCPCGSADVAVTDGRQLMITSVEVR